MPVAHATDAKWASEYQAFLRLQPSLLQTHRGQYVAIHDGRVVDSGDNQVDVALRAYEAHGHVSIHVGLVTDQLPRVVRIRSPRLMRGPAGWRATSTGIA